MGAQSLIIIDWCWGGRQSLIDKRMGDGVQALIHWGAIIYMWIGGGGGWARINSSKAYKILSLIGCFINYKWGIDLIFYGACFVLYKTLEAFDSCCNCSVLQW